MESQRSLQILLSGGVLDGNIIQSALPNELSPGKLELITLSDGNNTIETPAIPDVTLPTALTIIPPSANEVPITLKGVNGDTGIELNLVDPTTIALSEDFVSLVLHADGEDIEGVQLIWS